MKKILFLTDYSTVAENAYLYALAVAKQFGAEVHILHIAGIFLSGEAQEGWAVHPLAQYIGTETEQQEWNGLRREAAVLQKMALQNGFDDVPVEFHFEEGNFFEIVEDFILEQEIDLLVAGTAGHNSVEKKLLGTHTDRLLEQIKIPILAVPSKARYTTFTRMAAGVMLNPKEARAVATLARYNARLSRNLTCIHIVKNTQEQTAAQKKIGAWKTAVGEPNLEIFVEINADAEKGLQEFVEKNAVDTFCIIHRELSYLDRLFTKNFARSLMNHARTALLIIKR